MILTDSTGKPLPGNFDSLPSTFTYESDNLKTEVKTSGATTWTQTYTWTDGKLTAVTAWVRA